MLGSKLRFVIIEEETISTIYIYPISKEVDVKVRRLTTCYLHNVFYFLMFIVFDSYMDSYQWWCIKGGDVNFFSFFLFFGNCLWNVSVCYNVGHGTYDLERRALGIRLKPYDIRKIEYSFHNSTGWVQNKQYPHSYIEYDIVWELRMIKQ